LSNQSYWAVPFNAFSVNGANVAITANAAIIDSGTSLIAVGPTDYATIFAQLAAHDPTCSSSSQSCSCTVNNVSSYPTLTFTLGSYSFSLAPQFYLLAESGVCEVLIEEFNILEFTGVNAWILGDVFLRSYYAFFCSNNMTIGFALAASTDMCPLGQY